MKTASPDIVALQARNLVRDLLLHDHAFSFVFSVLDAYAAIRRSTYDGNHVRHPDSPRQAVNIIVNFRRVESQILRAEMAIRQHLTSPSRRENLL